MIICENCIFRDTVQLQGQLIPVCKREKVLYDSLKAYGREYCNYFASLDDVIKLQEDVKKNKSQNER